MEPKLGDHLITSTLLYTHHGIYCGHDRVVHYSGSSSSGTDGKIEVCHLSKFIFDDYKIVQHPTRIYTPEQSIERAFSRLGETRYCLIFNNCEHFVNWCIDGESVSEQVEQVRWGAGLMFELIFPSTRT